MPGMYHGGDYDLAGFCVGVVERSQVLDGSRVQAGDAIIGMASSGVHSNGYSLVRKLIEVAGADESTMLAGRPLFDRLLEPTRIYVKSMLQLAAALPVSAFAHITGGGLTDNIPRILPEGTAVKNDKDSWSIPPLFELLRRLGNVSESEMYRTFNMGIGMVIVASAGDVDVIAGHLGETCYRIGSVISGNREVLI